MSKLTAKQGLLTIILLSLIPLTPLLTPGMFWAHDSQSHIVRIASFYQSLSEGNIFPRWSHSLNAGYGHPIFMFLYPLPSYIASAFIFLGTSVVGSIKAVLAVSYLGTGIAMYLWLKKHFSSSAALVGSAVFQLAPYRFVNLYVRNALGEHTAFLFIPLTLLTLFKLYKKPTSINLGLSALSLAGLILAHNAISLMFLPIIAGYALILVWIKPKKSSTFLNMVLSGLLGLGLAAFFWLPAFLEGKYTLRDTVMRGDTFATHFPSFKQLVLPHWGYGNSYAGKDDDLSLQIGVVQWLAFVGGFLVWKKSKKTTAQTHKALGLLALSTFILSTFLLLEASLPIWKTVTIIKKFQFPWRLLILPVFSSSILAALFFNRVKSFSIPKGRSRDLLPSTKARSINARPTLRGIKSKRFLQLVIIALVVQNFSYWKPRGDILPEEKQIIQEYLGTSDTGESTPLWAVRSQDKRADDTLGVVHGAPIKYDIIKRQSEIHEHTITASVPTQVAENTLYFPGWTAYIDGQEVDIIFTDQNWRGVITYQVPAGTHYIKLVFEETKLRLLADYITLASIGFLVLFLTQPKILKSIKKYA